MTSYYQDDHVALYQGDCLDVLAAMPDNSVDSIVTDPPYGLGFMGKKWDDLPPSREWAEACYRVLKPGGHLVAFGGSRTWHRLAVAIEDAGFEMRDSLAWLYGSGFPKSHDVGKAIDKRRDEDLEPQARVAKWLVDRMAEKGMTRKNISDHFNAANVAQQWTTYWTDGAVKPRVPKWDQWQELKRLLGFSDELDAEVWRLNGRKGKPGEAWEKREVVGAGKSGKTYGMGGLRGVETSTGSFDLTSPATPEAAQWDGWGTALKPAFEPIVLARKPLEGTVARNVLEHGTGAINIDATRIPTSDDLSGGTYGGVFSGSRNEDGSLPKAIVSGTKGRWPANVLLDEHAAAWVDEQSGTTRSTIGVNPPLGKSGGIMGKPAPRADAGKPMGHNDKGGASRFFYCAKAPKTERPNVDGIQHPTVKPLAIMQWLIRLVTPPGGTVLDPFAGSGTTIEAAMMESFTPIGIEKETDYLPLITARITRAKTSAQGVLDLGGIA